MSRHREPGRVAQIPLGDGFVAWGRQLRGANVKFYNRFDPESDAENVTPQEAIDGDVAFTVAVMDSAFRRASNWTLCEVVPLSKEERTEVYRKFKQDPFSGALSVYWERPDGSWGEDAATPADCVGLEPAAVWDTSTSRTGCVTSALGDRTSGSTI